VTDGNSVRLSLDNDAKSAALAARNPRHGYSPGNSKRASDTAVDYSITSSAARHPRFRRTGVTEYSAGIARITPA
jgi:hypothetical protein